MRTKLTLWIIMIVVLCASAFAQVTVNNDFYYAYYDNNGNFQTTNQALNDVSAIGFVCNDNVCSGVSSVIFNGATLNSGANDNSIQMVYPQNKQYAPGAFYGVYVYKDGYIPWEIYATWYGTGTAPGTYDGYLAKVQTCAVGVDSFSVINDVHPNQPIMIDIVTSLDSNIMSPIIHAGYLDYVPPQIQRQYQVDTKVIVEVLDSNNQVVHTDNQNVLIDYSGEERVQFSYTPTQTGTYTARVYTIVEDDKCLSTASHEATQIFSVIPAGPTQQCYTLLDNLETPVQQCAAQVANPFSFQKVSNYYDSYGNLHTLATDAEIKVFRNGVLVYDTDVVIPANVNVNDYLTYNFTWTPTQGGWHTMQVTAIAQNCPYSTNIPETETITVYVVPPTTTNSCTGPDGSTIAHGSSQTYYQQSSGVCTSEVRTCNNGALSGSFQYATCTPTNNACTGPNGETVAHGSSITLFQSSTVAYGQSCVSQARVCNNGHLSGSYTFQTCTPQGPNSCTGPDGSTIAHGSSQTYYQQSSGVCTSEHRVCTNGHLSGSFQYATCTPTNQACTGPNGETVAHGSSITLFQSNSVPYGQYCVSQARVCTNGHLSGSYTFQTCTVQQPQNHAPTISGLPDQLYEVNTNHPSIFDLDNFASDPDGDFLTFQMTQSNTNVAFCARTSQNVVSCTAGSVVGCSLVTVTVSDGSLTDFDSFSVCTTPATTASCTGPDGTVIAHGSANTYFQTQTTPYGQSCVSEQRVCNNGHLSGSFQYATCTPQGPNSCTGPDGTVLQHGQSKTYFHSGSVAYGQTCSGETRTCNDGVLSGSFQFGTCNVSGPNTCTGPNNETIPHGSSLTYYQQLFVPYGQSCNGEVRTCNDGSLSGSFGFLSCIELPPAACTGPNGENVPHGQSLFLFQTNGVPYGQSCNGEFRTCSNGVLSGSFTEQSCSVGNPSACVGPNGENIPHGQSQTFFYSTSVPFGQSCNSEVRSCNNGALSGSFSAANCSPQPPASCTGPNGENITHGTSQVFFQTSTVPYGQTCTSEHRVCSNGVLSGGFSFAACAQEQPADCVGPNNQTIPHGSSQIFYKQSSGICEYESRMCSNGVLSGSFSFTACQANQPPVASFPNVTMQENEATRDVLTLSTYIVDPENDPLTIQIIGQSAPNIVECSLDVFAHLICTTKANKYGTSVVTVEISDGISTVTAPVNVNVIRYLGPLYTGPQLSPEQDRVEEWLYISQFKVLEDLTSPYDGDLHVFMDLRNEGEIDFENVRVTISFPELGLVRKVGPFDLDTGDWYTKELFFQTYHPIEPGYYTVRMSIRGEDDHDGEVHRIVHREVLVR